MKLLVWNIEWATSRSRRGRYIREVIAELQPDLVSMTEGTADMLPAQGHAIEAHDDYGYGDMGPRRKVLLWSVDREGDPEIPGGRFVSGTTRGIRTLGVCIPWRDAHVRTGRRDREPWEDHLAYLGGVERVIRASSEPMLVVGDFNQRLPRHGQPMRVYDALVQKVGDRTNLAGVA